MNESDVGKFLRLLAHDLQNQLGAIDLNLQIMPTLLSVDDPASETLAPFLKRASAGSADMIETLGDVQSFARAVSHTDDEGRPERLPVSKIDLSMKTRDCGLHLSPIAASRQVTLKLHIEDGVFATGESESVKRAIKILASEALRSAFPGSSVEILVSGSPIPVIEVAVSLEGIFDEQRPLLSMFLAKELLKDSQVQLLFRSESERSAIQLLFQPA